MQAAVDRRSGAKRVVETLPSANSPFPPPVGLNFDFASRGLASSPEVTKPPPSEASTNGRSQDGSPGVKAT